MQSRNHQSGDERHSPGWSQTDEAWSPQDYAAAWLTIIDFIQVDLSTRMARANERLLRSQDVVAWTTELIALSREAIAHSEQLLERGGRH